MGKSGTFPQQALASLNLCFLLLLLCLAACGGRGDGAASEQGSGASLPDLEAALEQEFQRLGIDPGKVAAAAPSGSENAVFDLALTLSDPDGEGPLPAESVTLTWTERFIGDYDQNGLVNVSDLTPLGINFLDTVAYDDPALHGGLEYWPQGDPDAGGAANWRRARVDGDGNGQVNISDITPIAQHWNERLSGYRLYLKEPGDSDFEPVEFSLQPPPPPVSPEVQYFTVAHPANPAANAPVRYSYTLSLPEAGVNQLYLVSYDLGSNMEGEPTGIVSIDSSTGTVNQSPVAKLTVTPDFAGAPAEITLDATASFDLDGTISAYEWDLDGDGSMDWLSSDPLPETSSTGTITNIASPEPGKVTATFTQGSDEYYFPKVTVSDNLADTSTPATDQLGISGWEYEFISSQSQPSVIGVGVSGFTHHPQTGQLVVYGVDLDGSHAPAYAIRTGAEQWEKHSSVGVDSAQFLNLFGEGNWGIPRIQLVWDEHNRPVFLFQAEDEQFMYSDSYFITSQQQANGQWELIQQIEEHYPSNNYFAQWPYRPITTDVGEFSFLVTDFVLLPDGSDPSFEESILLVQYETGQWRTELIPLGLTEGLRLNPAGQFTVSNREDRDLPYTLDLHTRTLPESWTVNSLSLPGATGNLYKVSIGNYGHNGNSIVAYYEVWPSTDASQRTIYIARLGSNEQVLHQATSGQSIPLSESLYYDHSLVAFSTESTTPPFLKISHLDYFRYEGSTLVTERVKEAPREGGIGEIDPDYTEGYVTTLSPSKAYAYIEIQDDEEYPELTHLLGIRIDPRYP